MDSSKYYFIKGRNYQGKIVYTRNSFTIDEILESSRFALPKAFKGKSLRKDKGNRFTYIHDPSGTITNEIIHFSPQESDSIKDIEEKIKHDVIETLEKYHLVMDKTKMSGDKLCSLTQDEFKNPYWLNINGRTYEFDSIKEAINKTLFMDENLRLEDVTLTPEMLDRIRLTPNDDLFDPQRVRRGIEYCPDLKELKIFPYDESRIRKNNIPNFSSKVREILDFSDENNCWRYKELWEAYALEKDLEPKWSGDKLAIRDLELTGIILTKYHPKCNTGKIIFKNIHFIDCVIDCDACWCGAEFKDCKFSDCVMMSSKPSSYAQFTLTRCTKHNCKVISRS